MRHYGRTVTLAPDYAEALINLVNTLQGLGQPLDAMPYSQRALAIAPNDDATLAAAAEALERVEGIGPARNHDALRAVLVACLARPIVESNTVNIPSQALMARDFSIWLKPTPVSLSIDDLSRLCPISGGLLSQHLMDSLITEPDL
ncbi:hypothetical protein N9F34_03555, partial [Alphaproteobacteria bacterium]|nr:hypothetical protein [Alphaproteobacteria bacterium]